MGQQALAIGAHPEEIGFFLELFHRTVAVRALAVLGLGLGPEGLTRGAVPVLVLTQIDVTPVHQLFEDMADTLLMAFLGGADEVAVGDAQFFPQCLEPLDHAVGQFKRCLTGRQGRLFNLLAMLIAAGQKKDIVPFEPLVTGQNISRQRCVGMADMGHIVHIVDRGGQIKGRLHGAYSWVGASGFLSCGLRWPCRRLRGLFRFGFCSSVTAGSCVVTAVWGGVTGCS